MADSNIEQVQRWLDQLGHVCDFDGPGATGGTFADELFDAYADHVYDRSVGAAKAPDGSNWEDNRESTKRRKTTNTVGVESGEMLSLEQLKGVREIGPDEATLTYGTSQSARDKLNWFTRGSEENPAPADVPDCRPSGASNQPSREVWGMDEAIEREFAERVGARLLRAAQEWGLA